MNMYVCYCEKNTKSLSSVQKGIGQVEKQIRTDRKAIAKGAIMLIYKLKGTVAPDF